MNCALIIGLTTFREHLRDKIFYNVPVFALLLMGSSIFLVRLNHGDSRRLILDLGLSCLNLFGTIIAIFIGIGLVNKEISARTIDTIISKPIARHEFLLGKYLGLLATLGANTTLMLGGLISVLLIMDVTIEPLLFKAVLLIFLELMIVTAAALFFSTFTTVTLSAIFTLAVYVIGHLVNDLGALSTKLDAGARLFVSFFYYVLPNLERFNLKGRVTHQLEVGNSELVFALAYGLLYTIFLLYLATLTFKRRDCR